MQSTQKVRRRSPPSSAACGCVRKGELQQSPSRNEKSPRAISAVAGRNPAKNPASVVVASGHQTCTLAIAVLLNSSRNSPASLTPQKTPRNRDISVWPVIDGHRVEFYVLKRPFVDELLEFLSDKFEVVVFTAGKLMLLLVLDRIDRKPENAIPIRPFTMILVMESSRSSFSLLVGL
ncbi:hypothetical protein HAX54_000464 [Datura stramonium]|uniref:FCP1 homology domain-containing protein n=1 Tax=Datura stramonium TaxID=4076 RepID=A0ABS8WUT0_DATST|nr:hypothetical protein [Datura stramonium]